MHDPMFAASRALWEAKYRAPRETRLNDTWRRVAEVVAAAEHDRERWVVRFEHILEGFHFLPGGRILAGAGLERRVTLLNCFVMGTIRDSLDGIFQALKEGALTMQQGGGVGYDFSTLRPRGARAGSSGSIPSGPVSFLQVWDAMAQTVLSTGLRRGAMMATLRCDHPDIEGFIAAKSQRGALTHFNQSVLVTDELVEAVREDREIALVFPELQGTSRGGEGEIVMRRWSGSSALVPCRVYRVVRARELWASIVRSAYDHGEPGVLFVDRINRANNLWYTEDIAATNPCGEVPLPPYGACDLGSINLTRFVAEPFTRGARIDEIALIDTVKAATRFLDDVLDVTHFPLEPQARRARETRRVGLGVTGLADALVMLGLRYDEAPARELATRVLRTLCHAAYEESIELARERGSFPRFARDRFLAGEFASRLPAHVREGIARFGLRNSHLIAIAPAGSISVLAGGVSTGIEPIYAASLRRPWSGASGEREELVYEDYAVALYRRLRGDGADLPPALVTVDAIAPEAHLEMQAALQPFVDNSIAKTVNLPRDFPFDRFESMFLRAYDRGLKGCTAFRPNPVTGELLGVGEKCLACDLPAEVGG
jgi:ribonucleoside-diphosphate reductase alpha chain